MIPKMIEPNIVKYLYAKAIGQHIPISGTFELTPMCNMKCEMCYVRMSKKQMEQTGGRLRTKEEWISLAQTAKDKGMLFLLLTGGEPFLYPEFRELYEELIQMGFVLSINTNGTLIDEETVLWLKNNPPARINITLYGACNETYEKLCHNQYGYTQVTNAIRMLTEAGISVKLNCSVNPYNAHDLEEMIRYAETYGLILQAATYMFPPVRRDEKMIGYNKRFSPREAARIAGEIVRLQYGDKKFVEYLKELRAGNGKIEGEQECLKVVGDKVLCSAGRCAFWITWDGRMIPCGMMSRPYINTWEEGFENAWSKIGSMVEQIRMPVKCAVCKEKERCQSCAAMTLTETGAFDQVPEYRCMMTKCYLEECEQLCRYVEVANE